MYPLDQKFLDGEVIETFFCFEGVWGREQVYVGVEGEDDVLYADLAGSQVGGLLTHC